MHLPASSTATPAITIIPAVTTTVTTTVTTVVTTTAIAAAKYPPPYKDYSGSLWILFLGIVGSVIAKYIAGLELAEAARPQPGEGSGA